MNVIIRQCPLPMLSGIWFGISIAEQSVNHSAKLCLFNFCEDRCVCIHMVEDDEQQYNECDDNGNIGSCFLVVLRITKRIPCESYKKKEV